MSKETKTVWVTKYALTRGVEKMQAEVKDNGYATIHLPGHPFDVFLRKSDYALNEHEAYRQALHLRNAKIASLRKQIAKLEQLKF